jgi:hypothetical protein
MQLNDDLLWDYADGLLTDAEAEEVRRLLTADLAWQTRLTIVLAERAALKAIPLERPKPNFADRVMTAWVTEQTGKPAPSPTNDRIAYAVSGALCLLIAVPLLTIIIASFRIKAQPVNLKLPVNLPTADHLTPFFQSQGLLYVLLLLASLAAWQFIDRYIQLRKATKMAPGLK